MLTQKYSIPEKTDFLPKDKIYYAYPKKSRLSTQGKNF